MSGAFDDDDVGRGAPQPVLDRGLVFFGMGIGLGLVEAVELEHDVAGATLAFEDLEATAAGERLAAVFLDRLARGRNIGLVALRNDDAAAPGEITPGHASFCR